MTLRSATQPLDTPDQDQRLKDRLQAGPTAADEVCTAARSAGAPARGGTGSVSTAARTWRADLPTCGGRPDRA